MKNVSLSLPRFVCRANWDLELGSETTLGLIRCHEFNGGLKIGKRASVENYIFLNKLYCLDLREILIT